MSQLQILIDLVLNLCELRITITDHQTDIQLWTYPSANDRTQKQIDATTQADPETAALAIMDSLSDASSRPTQLPTHTNTHRPTGVGSQAEAG